MRVEGERGVTTGQWRGVIEEYRELLDIPQDVPAVTLARGRHAAGASPAGCPGSPAREVWLKVEGDNPTGSFKDRGMTTAISVAVARRRQGRRLRVHRQHLGVDGRVRRAGPA